MDIASFDYTKYQNEFIQGIIYFIYNHLDKWRGSKDWTNTENEKLLNSDLIKYLNGYARTEELKANFFSDELQGNFHSVDIVACHFNKDIENFREAIVVFECKRLSSVITGKRKDEYVTGHNEKDGGIQRFKLEIHGSDYNIVGMIGYIQTGNYQEWFNKINSVIEEISIKPDENGLVWTKDEFLKMLENDSKKGKHYSNSIHSRKTKENIIIHHLWIDMQKGDGNE